MVEEKNPSVDAAKAAILSGLSPTMITYLSRIEVFKPASHSSPQRGKRRVFTFADVLFLKVIADLLAKGIEVKRLGAALRRAKEDSGDWLNIKQSPRRFLVTDGTELFVRREGQLESRTFNGQLAFGFVFDLRETHRELLAKWPDAAEKAA
jgi:DNA-binding transcriptional MerR regulator